MSWSAGLVREIVRVHADDGQRPRHSATDAAFDGLFYFSRRMPMKIPIWKTSPAGSACRVRGFSSSSNHVSAYSPQQYLDWARLGIATDALIYSNKSVSDIADELGFSQQTHFTRFFPAIQGRAATGVSPPRLCRRASV